MAGSHRASGKARSGRLASGLVAVLAVAAAIGGVYLVARDDSPGGTAMPSEAPSSSSSPTRVPAPTSSPSPTRTAVAQPARLPRVAASPPRRFVVRGLIDVGFDSAVAPRNGVFSAGSTAEVARWGGRGVPGSPADDTVFVIGKVSPGGALARLPVLQRGARIVLRTGAGSLTYTVQSVEEKPARDLTSDKAFAARVGGRLQVVGIRYSSDGDRTGTILVVTAVLTGARAGG